MESLGSNQLTHLQRLDKTLSEHKDTNCKSINDEPFASLDCWLHDTKTKSQQSLVKKIVLKNQTAEDRTRHESTVVCQVFSSLQPHAQFTCSLFLLTMSTL